MLHAVMIHPFAILLISFVGLWAAANGGVWVRDRAPPSDEQRTDLGLITAATLTLLGLLIGFSFSMATNRYDQRKNFEAAEANAIGTEYARADLLPPSDGSAVRNLLKRYTELRIRFYAESDRDPALGRDTSKLQSEMWATVVRAAAAKPDPLAALAVNGMNEVLNSQAFTQAAWWNHIPMSAAVLMAIIAVLCNGLVGYGSRTLRLRNPLLCILPLFVAVAFMLIVDIDTPAHGLIEVVPRNLMGLLPSLQ